MHRESARELRSALNALRQTDVASAAQRLAAYGTLEAAIRQHAGAVTALPAAALTPAELRDRLGSSPVPFSADEISRILAECQQARYQPIERLAAEARFHATLDAATALFADSR
jgi:integrase